MKKLLSLSFIMGLLLTVTPLALAHGEQGATHQSNLDLSQEVLEKVNDLQAEYYEKIDEVQDQLRVKNRELKKLYSDQEAKDKDIIKLRTEIKELDNKIFDLKTARYLELKKLVPAEKLGAMIKQMHGNGQGMMGGNMMTMMKQMHGNGQGMMNGNMMAMMKQMCGNSQGMMKGDMKDQDHGHSLTEDSNMSNHTVEKENMNNETNN
ncbi:hypothetical protein BX659_13912 [Orenia metallireducens]|uniref:Periplasmic heavy metal sensor n=1 Tax=Orenia metallireducens TaxID=1413210 RepID=A0A285IE23_9FIRM|nr:hypothetical protein [Orenia metallireducens]PRX19231.1 hypothetical protein BX659_13912 [Orenia metallireducens]SNY46238.1 hypothetical protein SAMN06265827_14118 [Orenia metallireducens]